jgi:hypothetical protein
MFVINNSVLDRLQGDIDDIVDFIKTLVSEVLALSLLKVKSEVVDGPFATMTVVVVIRKFVNSYVCQVDKHIVSFTHIVGILGYTEASKTKFVDPCF